MTRAAAPGGTLGRDRELRLREEVEHDQRFWDALAKANAHQARLRYLRSMSGYAAMMLATDLTTCRALLYGRPVPQHRLCPELVRALDLEPGAPVGLTANLVEQVLLHTPLPAETEARKAA